MLTPETTALLVIDVQGKLARSVLNSAELFRNIEKMIRGAGLLGIPVVWIEQYPQGLGPTIPELARLMENNHALAKTSFDCCGSEPIMQELSRINRPQLLVCGIETHVCVYQSVIGLLQQGYQVEVINDAVSSRTIQNRQLGLAKMVRAGASETSTEMCLFELTRRSDAPPFKAILELVK